MTQVSREVTGRIFDPDQISNATNQLAARITNLEGTVFNADGFSRAVRYALGLMFAFALSLLAVYAFNIPPP